MKRGCVILTVLICFPFFLYSQTGPGGVSNSAGTLKLWLDGKRVNADGSNPANGGNVALWHDKSGNNLTLTGNQPNVATYGANGVVFNNTGYLAGSDAGFPAGNAARTVFIVTSTPATTADDALFFYGTAANNQSYGILKIGGSSEVRNFFYGNDFDVANAWTPYGTLKIITATYTNNTQSVYVNNGTASTRTPTVPNTLLGGTGGLQVGGWSSFGLNSQATIAEVVFHNGLLNAAQINIVNNYLAAKYGLTLAANDLYDEDNASNGNFDFDVAGIGRVSATALHADAQSSIVRISNPNSLGDSEYYLWGHDGATLQPTTANIPASVQARLTRIWRGSETGNVGSVTVRFDLSNMGPVVAGNLRLLIDTDNDGSFTDETPIGSATSVGNDVYQFSGITALNNNLRFTLATTNTTTTPLPIELAWFKATANEGYVQLQWQTATEIDNDYFAIERSKNGHDWKEISRVTGAGNSKQVLNYEAQDLYPDNGINYYRLKQVDFDGTSAVSDVEAVDFTHRHTVFPNPTEGLVNVIIASLQENEGSEEIVIYNSLGDISKVPVVRLSDTYYQVDLSQSPAGIYLIKSGRKITRVYKR